MSKRKLVKAIQNLFKPIGNLSHTASGGRSKRASLSNLNPAKAVQNFPKLTNKLFHTTHGDRQKKANISKINPVKAVQNLFKPISKPSRRSAGIRGRSRPNWLLRSLMIRGRSGWASSGFVLPTVVMVLLVVILLTTAIVFRSFDRSKNASNFRVNEAVLNASAPALDRARAKLDELFADPTLPRSVPSDSTLYNTFTNPTKIAHYTFGDEVPLTVAYNATGPSGTGGTLKTAWKFPVDTNNNGKFDSYTLYGIYFQNPPLSANTANFSRARDPLEARTPPMSQGATSPNCPSGSATSASLVGNTGWYKIDGNLKKSFFVFAVNVPITGTTLPDPKYYETYKGNKGFSALEFQQDRTQIPLTNNAVVYEDDIDLTPGPQFRLNGRIVTNSNLLTGVNYQPIRLFQVSSQDSCYYDPDNGKILIGGNVSGNGPISANNPANTGIDLFGDGSALQQNQILAAGNLSTTNTPNQVAYNSQAYAQRIDLLVNAQLQPNTTLPKTDPNYGLPTTSLTTDPSDVQKNVNDQIRANPSQNTPSGIAKLRQQQLEIYFRNRTRRVPFAEVPYGSNATTGFTQSSVLQGSIDTLRPPQAWIDPTTSTNLSLNTANLPETDPTVLQPRAENLLGDRILVGNNLPAIRWDVTQGKFLTEDNPQDIPGQTWDGSSKTRQRTTRVRQLADLGVTDRDGFWEVSAAAPQQTVLDAVGGMRVVTGAGLYQRNGSFLPNLSPATYDDPNTAAVEQYPIVWADSMPMSNPNPPAYPNGQRSDLVMRATAIYHFMANAYNPTTPGTYQTPIACVSSYYDPTNRDTARNPLGLPDVSGELVDPLTGLAVVRTANARSNNGVSYTPPTTTAQTIGTSSSANGLFTVGPGADVVQKVLAGPNVTASLRDRLNYQANLVFPSGRFVNPQLRQALTSRDAGHNLTLAEQSAIDSSICALQIADGSINPSPAVIPHGAIKETAFLDARQIKAIDKSDAPSQGTYNLEIEQRQPLEIHATVLDLSLLRTTTIGSASPAQEYLIPNSGIIYASRDDAQADASDPTSANNSATDYVLDPERRPQGIMLINGSNLSRVAGYRPEEKGLILATNLPAYVKGNFNRHTGGSGEEFNTTLNPASWNNFYNDVRTAGNLNTNFACRPGDPRLPSSSCTSGDTWRSASVIADAVTLLSDSFRPGFRNEGDYDLRNNQADANGAIAARLKQGFWNNNFVTSANFQDSNYSGNGTALNSSYLNNFVTPVQRRTHFSEYVMEICRNLPASNCTSPSNWIVGITSGNQNAHSWDAGMVGTNRSQLVAGTTVLPASQVADQRYARRVAFKRNSDGTLVSPPSPLVISGGVVSVNGTPDQVDNALWFATTADNADPPNPSNITYSSSNSRLFYLPLTGSPPDLTSQPLLLPVLQFQVTTASGGGPSYQYLVGSSQPVYHANWLPTAAPTTFNLVAAAGDTPARVGTLANGTPAYERNGGLHNFVRFLESWQNTSGTIPASISGSFIQFKRSAYATAPYQVFLKPSAPTQPDDVTPTVKSLFPDRVNDNTNYVSYNSNSTPKGEAPYYLAPTRNWGFDVALLSQTPDLFAQRFVVPPGSSPDQYFREVGRDDPWVQTLLCAAQSSDVSYGSATSDYRSGPTDTSPYYYAVPPTERPSNCSMISGSDVFKTSGT